MPSTLSIGTTRIMSSLGPENGRCPKGEDMIKSITIQNYKSFDAVPPKPIVLDVETQMPVFFYGRNGAGKTAIGEVICGCGAGDALFQNCKVDVTQGGPFRFHVYNHNFIRQVIGEPAGMPGIFTIGELDTATQKKIEEQEASLQATDTERLSIQNDVDSLDAQLATALTTAREEVWNVYKSHDKGVFDDFLTGYGRDKQKFFDDLRTYETADDAVLADLATLEKRLRDVSGTEAAKATHQVALGAFAPIENDTIWKQPIEVSGASRLAPLIEKLGNGDWVSQGRVYVHDDQCPFCQQGLPHDFTAELTRLLDGDRQAKIDAIASQIRNYDTAIHALKAAMTPPLDEPFSSETNLQSVWETVHAKLKANLATMRLKQQKPGGAVNLAETDVEPLRIALASLNTRIDEFNQRIRDRAGERNTIKKLFWQNMCRNKISVYRTYDTVATPLREKRTTAETDGRAATMRRTACINALADLRKRQEGVDASVDAINERLGNLGIDSFTIAKKDGAGSLYCLKRPHHGESNTKSLSEGEKTLISFLYFMELLKGSAQQGAVVDVRKTIVVIDDPISSLSHNFVYDVATIICQELIRPPGGQQVRQVIVLTHSLFFLHELTYQLGGGNLEKAADKCQLLRVVKGTHSQVKPMNARDFANDYDALWQIVRDAQKGIVPTLVVPNTMRCILESFFAFTGARGHFEKILEQLSSEDATFKPLERYLNRGAHRDGINAMNIDWGQFNIDYYLTKLEAVFTKADYAEHYRMKMGLANAA